MICPVFEIKIIKENLNKIQSYILMICPIFEIKIIN